MKKIISLICMICLTNASFAGFLTNAVNNNDFDYLLENVRKLNQSPKVIAYMKENNSELYAHFFSEEIVKKDETWGQYVKSRALSTLNILIENPVLVGLCILPGALAQSNSTDTGSVDGVTGDIIAIISSVTGLVVAIGGIVTGVVALVQNCQLREDVDAVMDIVEQNARKNEHKSRHRSKRHQNNDDV